MRAINRVPVTERLRLLNKMEAIGMLSGGRGVSSLVAGQHHHANLIYPCAQDFFDDNGERRLGHAVPIDKTLQWKRPLVFAGGRNDCALDFHNGAIFWATASQIPLDASRNRASA